MIEFIDVCKKYKGTTVIDGFNLKIEKGNIVALIGESGSGKTTLLKMINRLIKLSEGQIVVNGTDIGTWDPIELRRKIGYVIQQHGLFPHMTIKENIQIIPQLLGKRGEFLEAKTKELLELVGLDPKVFIDRYPAQLSGGQQQRVGVARALITDPEIILMDEPFSALDPMTRSDLQDQLLNIQEEFNKTIVFVTHDMDEAIKLADKICILRNGKILQYDTPENILKHPNGEYVEQFIGKGKIWNNPALIKPIDAAIANPGTISKKRTVLQAMETMREKKIDGLLVVDKDKVLLGYVSLSKLKKIEHGQLTIEQVMSSDVPTIDENGTLIDVVDQFSNTQLGYLAIVDEEDRLKGLITRSSLLSLLGSQFIEKGDE